MTPLSLLDSLKSELEPLLKLQSTANKTGFNVYLQNTPPKQHDKDYSMFPCCIISLGDGEQNQSTATQDIVFVFGTRDEKSDYQGYRDVANALESTRQHLIEHYIIDNRFQLKLPLKWIIPQTDEVYPFYYGAIIATYEIPIITPTNQYT